MVEGNINYMFEIMDYVLPTYRIVWDRNTDRLHENIDVESVDIEKEDIDNQSNWYVL